MTGRRRVQGGLHWPKIESPAITTPPLPDQLTFQIAPFKQRAGQVIVTTGQQVLGGQALTHSDDYLTVPVYASSSGTVTDIDEQQIVVVTDGVDQHTKPIPPIDKLTRNALITVAHQGGLVGHGGAGFPLAAKLSNLASEPYTLLINAAECDPDIFCDDALITSVPTEIANAIVTVASACNIRKVIVGIENNKTKSTKLLTEQFDAIEHGLDIDVVSVPSRYPSGAEHTLLALCDDHNCGDHCHQSGSLAKAGILSMNIASVYALAQAASTGTPCTSRITTVIAPDGRPYNFQTKLGTPTTHLFQQVCSKNTAIEHCEITIGGRMMPTVADSSKGTNQSTNCVTFKPVKATQQVSPCIRCGNCAEVCPAGLLPQALHQYANNFNSNQLDSLKLDHCIECRCCDVVCPSNIPLARQFYKTKQRKSQSLIQAHDAELAKRRYHKREQRMALIASGARARRSKPKAAQVSAQRSRKALIDQALQRKRQQNTADDGNNG